MKAQPKLSDAMRTGNFLLPDNGDVLDAICLRTFYPLLTRVGARRRLTLNQYLGYHPILVGRLAATIELCQENALILASYFAMRVHAPLVRIWVLFKVAFAARSQSQGDVWIRITKPAGVVGKSAGIPYHAESILARNHAMRVCAALVRSPWTADAIVAKTSEQLSAVSAVMKDQVSAHERPVMILRT